jgi:hypothetical protein
MPRRNVNVRQAIQHTLSGKTMTWSALLRETKVSKGALSINLNKLIDRKVVLTRTRETRPPQTVYYLANQRYVNLVLFVTEGMTKEESDYFFNNVLTVDIFEILTKSYEKILNFMRSKALPSTIPITNIFSIKEKEDLEKLNKIWENLPHMNVTMWQILNVDFDSMSEPECEAWEANMFNQVAVQFILTIYQLEKLFLEYLPEEFHTRIKKKGDLANTLVLGFVQEKNLWQEFDRFFNWWYKTMTAKIPGSELLGMLALSFYMTTYA